jgi:hypothetical protein
MRPIRLTITGVGISLPQPMDARRNPFSVGMGVTASGTVTYSVQHTFDDVQAPAYNPATGNWFNHVSLVAATASGDGAYQFPITALRLNVTAGTGTATLQAIQSGDGP